jgi:hypothetical protein
MESLSINGFLAYLVVPIPSALVAVPASLSGRWQLHDLRDVLLQVTAETTVTPVTWTQFVS